MTAIVLSKTIEKRNQCQELSSQLSIMENAPSKVAETNSELNRIEQIIGQGKRTEEDFRQIILEKTTHYCEKNKIRIKDIPEPFIIDRSDYEVITHNLVLAGGFKQLVGFIYELEQNWKINNITSARFYTEKEVRTKRQLLNVELYIQNIQEKK